ncbi:MAG: peptidyl-tRNA hydrolase Pth2 [Candidatus Pacebacteria bacterium]|jgi:PTH2 family peptidyl-tRNA hydrolase|nr:peptidyl-tRNA hydrolase Pth2 [Candidatus Paceibacterota bacterium]
MSQKQAIIIRKDLNLKKGKLASQVAHAAIMSLNKSEYKEEWEREGQKKIVLWCGNLEELFSLYQKAIAENLPTAIVEDAGLTQIPKGTKTCIGIGPAPEEKIDKITADLKLVN